MTASPQAEATRKASFPGIWGDSVRTRTYNPSEREGQHAPPAVLRVCTRYSQLVDDQPRNVELDCLQVCFPIVFLTVLLYKLKRAAVHRRAAFLVPNR